MFEFLQETISKGDEMMVKKHKIETINDILDVVNSKNKDCFLKDFENWLNATIKVKEVTEAGAKLLGAKSASVECKGFTWIDDGKNDEQINITIKGE